MATSVKDIQDKRQTRDYHIGYRLGLMVVGVVWTYLIVKDIETVCQSNYRIVVWCRKEYEIKKIIIDFGDLVSELKNKKLELCNRKTSVGLFLLDTQSNLYIIEDYYLGSYLDK